MNNVFLISLVALMLTGCVHHPRACSLTRDGVGIITAKRMHELDTDARVRLAQACDDLIRANAPSRPTNQDDNLLIVGEASLPLIFADVRATAVLYCQRLDWEPYIILVGFRDAHDLKTFGKIDDPDCVISWRRENASGHPDWSRPGVLSLSTPRTMTECLWTGLGSQKKGQQKN